MMEAKLGRTASGAFQKQMTEALLQIAKATDDKVNYIVGEMLTRLVMRTPVGAPDTWGAYWRAVRGVEQGRYREGHARANWSVTIGSPIEYDIKGVDKLGAATIKKGKAALRGAGNTYWLSNAAHNDGHPYIMDLEYGWSSQAPAGFARITVAEWPMIVAEADRRFK